MILGCKYERIGKGNARSPQGLVLRTCLLAEAVCRPPVCEMLRGAWREDGVSTCVSLIYILRCIIMSDIHTIQALPIHCLLPVR